MHGVIARQSTDLELAGELASRLNTPLFSDEQGFLFEVPDSDALALIVSAGSLQLRCYESPKPSARRSSKDRISLAIDPQARDIQHRIKSGRKEPFARALGLHKSAGLKILDATAGLGRDAFVMYGLGAQVTLVERSPELHLLLQYAVTSASLNDHKPDTELQLLPCQDAIDYLNGTDDFYDVVYLDPMYPATRSNALPKKEMQLLRGLLRGPQDADALLAPAVAKSRRVVVKRPPHGAYMAEAKPHHSIEAKRVRYDVYLNHS